MCNVVVNVAVHAEDVRILDFLGTVRVDLALHYGVRAPRSSRGAVSLFDCGNLSRNIHHTEIIDRIMVILKYNLPITDRIY